jgi:hypothetical protein
VGKAVLYPAIAIKERTEKRDRAQDDGVDPDRRSENEVRA